MKTDENSSSANSGLKKYLYQGIVSFLVIAASVMFFFFLFRLGQIQGFFRKVSGILQPITLGIVIAYLLNPVVNFFERNLLKLFNSRIKNPQKAKLIFRYTSIFIALAIACYALYILGSLIIPELYVTIVGIVREMPHNVKLFTAWVENLTASNAILGDYLNQGIIKASEYLETWAQVDLLKQLNTWAGYFATGVISVLNLVKNLVIGLVVSIYVLASKERFSAQCKMIIYAVSKQNIANVIIDTFRHCNQIFGGFIIGKIIDSTIIGIICFIGLSFLNMPYTLLVSVIVGVTNIIPFFGPYIGAIPSSILILVVSPIHALYFLIFILVLQQLDGNIIGPKILGESTGLSAFWVVFSILLGAGLFGLPGMLIGVPAFAVIYYIVGRIISYLLEKKNLKQTAEEYEEIESIRTENGKTIYIPLESFVKAPAEEEKKEKKEAKPKEKTKK